MKVLVMTLREKLESLPRSAFVGETVSLRPIREEQDLAYAIFDCTLTREQQDCVNPAGFSIGRAYLHPENNYPCVILNAQGQRVGFILLYKWLGLGDEYSWSYYIDQRHQGKGYGRNAAKLAIRILKAADPAMPIKLATEAENRKAQKLYRSLGFKLLDEMDGDDLVFGL